MSPDDLLTLENLASMSRRDMLKLTGVAGIGGGGMSAISTRSSQQVTGETGTQQWRSELNNVIDITQGRLNQLRVKMNHTLVLLGVSKDPGLDPFDASGDSWQFTFKLRSSGLAMVKERRDPSSDSEKIWWPNKNGNIVFDKNGFEIAPPSIGSKRADYVAISARRDPDLFGAIPGQSLTEVLWNLTDENPETSYLTGFDPTEAPLNPARKRARMAEQLEQQHDFDKLLDAGLGVGNYLLGQRKRLSPLMDAKEGAEIAIDIGEAIYAIFTDNKTDDPVTRRQGVKMQRSEDLSAFSGHMVVFDVYVSPELGDNDVNEATVEVKPSFTQKNASLDINRKWLLTFRPDGDGVTVEPEAFNSDATESNWSHPPTPSIDPPPADPSSDAEGVLRPKKGQTHTFRASGSHYGSHPIETYEWYFAEPDGAFPSSPNETGLRFSPTFKQTGTHRVRLDVTDKNGQTATLTESYPVAGSGASFQIQSVDTPDSLPANKPMELSATIENTGTKTGTQTVQFLMTFWTETATFYTEEVTLDPGDRTTVTPTETPTDLDTGTFQFAVKTENDSVTSTVEVVEAGEAANFQITSVDAPNEVTTGDLIDISATIENTGTSVGTQTVTITSPLGSLGEPVEHLSTETELGPGGQTTVSPPEEIQSLDSASTFEFTVETADDSVTKTVSVIEADTSGNGRFELEEGWDPWPEQILVNAEVALQVKVTNTGQERGTQTIELRNEDTGEVGDSAQVTGLSPDKHRTVTLIVPATWTSTAGQLNLRIESEDHTKTPTFDVVSSDGLGLKIDWVDWGIGQRLTGEGVEIVARLMKSDPTESGTGSVELLRASDNQQLDAKPVELDSTTGSARITLWPKDGDGYPTPGQHTFVVRTGSGNAVERTIDVVEDSPARFEIQGQPQYPETHPVGESFTVEVPVKNTGGRPETQVVTLDRDSYSQVWASKEVSLEANQSTTVSLDVDASWTDVVRMRNGRIPDESFVNFSARTMYDEKRFTVRLIPPRPPNFQVSNVKPVSSDIAPGEPADISATIENTGTESGTKTVELLDGSGSQLDAISGTSIGGGESADVTLTVPAGQTSTTGTFQVTVETPDDSGTGAIQVGGDDTPADFQVTNLDGPYYEGTKRDWLTQPSNFHVTVVNSGGKSDTQTVRLRKAGGTEYDSTSISLAGGERTTITLTFPQSAAIPQSSFTMVAASEDDTQRMNVPVLNLDISLDIDI